MSTSYLKAEKNNRSENPLFSGTQKRLLALLFGHPERSFYARELIALAQAGTGAVQRELARLTASGLIISTVIGNQKHYQANPDSPVFSELRALIVKTFGVADKVREALLPLRASIDSAFLYGSMAKGNILAGSDVDVMIISDTLTLEDIFTALQPVEPMIGRVINPTLYTKNEFISRKEAGNTFLTKILRGKTIALLGTSYASS